MAEQRNARCRERSALRSRPVRLAWRVLLAEASSWVWLAPAAGLLLGLAGTVVGPWGAWACAPALAGGVGLFLDAYSRRELRQRAGELKVVMHDCLQPLARCILSLVTKTTQTKRMHALPNVLWTILTAAIAVTATDGSRASFFRRVTKNGEDLLVPDEVLSIGRGDAPVSRFARSDGEGKDVWRAAEADQVVFYPDILTAGPPDLDRDRERHYRTFITAPIQVKGSLAGLLTINAPSPGDLTDDDVGIMRVLATLAGVAITLCEGKWPEDGRDWGSKEVGHG